MRACLGKRRGVPSGGLGWAPKAAAASSRYLQYQAVFIGLLMTFFTVTDLFLVTNIWNRYLTAP